MFKNIGRKIKAFAKIVCWIGIILSLLAGIILIIAGINGEGVRTFIDGSYTYMDSGVLVVVGVFVLILGPLFSWIGSFMVYGFGELVDNVQSIKNALVPEQNAQPYYPQQPTYQDQANQQNSQQ